MQQGSWQNLCSAGGRVRYFFLIDQTLRVLIYFRFDLELPVECDDEYWVAEDSEDPFKQPAGQPSNISYFVAIIQLTNVLALVLRKIVSRSIVGIHMIDD